MRSLPRTRLHQVAEDDGLDGAEAVVRLDQRPWVRRSRAVSVLRSSRKVGDPACFDRCNCYDPDQELGDKPKPPKTQRSARSDGRFRGDSQSPGIGPRDARHHDGAHARPVRPSFMNEGMAPAVAASRTPSASISSISAAGDEQPDLAAARLGFRAAELQQLCGAPAAFFLCARAGGVWRGVAWRGVAWRVAGP